MKLWHEMILYFSVDSFSSVTIARQKGAKHATDAMAFLVDVLSKRPWVSNNSIFRLLYRGRRYSTPHAGGKHIVILVRIVPVASCSYPNSVQFNPRAR